MSKTVLFDGGPLDGEMKVIGDNEKIYECYTKKEVAGVKLNDPVEADLHIYEEDPNVPGHFLYRGVKR